MLSNLRAALPAFSVWRPLGFRRDERLAAVLDGGWSLRGRVSLYEWSVSAAGRVHSFRVGSRVDYAIFPMDVCRWGL